MEYYGTNKYVREMVTLDASTSELPLVIFTSSMYPSLCRAHRPLSDPALGSPSAPPSIFIPEKTGIKAQGPKQG